MNAAPLRVAVVDDDTVMREGLHLLLAPAGITAMPFATVEAFQAAAPQVHVILLDLDLSGTGRTAGLQGRDAVAALAPTRPVLIYTNQRRRYVLAACLAAGARGVLHKAEALDQLPAAIRAVAAGQIVVTTALTGLAETIARHGEMPELTDRQVQVLNGRARGEPFKSIATRLGISPRTAEEHMAAVTNRFATYLRTHSPADLERELGSAPGDLTNHRDVNRH